MNIEGGRIYMITVADLMLSPLFSTARLAAGKSGLSNNVLYIGFLDWESAEQIPKYFNAGEIVITTLMGAKDDPRMADKYLKALIMNNSSAVMIKEIYYREISEEIKSFAEERHVPIFFFSDIYVDEIIHEVKKQLETDVEEAGYESVLDAVFNGAGMAADELHQLVSQINPYFYGKSFVAVYISDDETGGSGRTERLYDYIHNNRNLLENIMREEMNIVYSRLIYKRGIMFIISFDTDDEEMVTDYGRSLIKRLLDDENFRGMRIGAGYSCCEEEFAFVIRRAIFANVKCVLDARDFLLFDGGDGDYAIFSSLEKESVRAWCRQTKEILTHPATKHMPLLETALTFSRCGGNVERTAAVLCQHKNTVRYRMDRIGEILGAENNIELYGKLYFFTRAYLSEPYLEMFFG